LRSAGYLLQLVLEGLQLGGCQLGGVLCPRGLVGGPLLLVLRLQQSLLLLVQEVLHLRHGLRCGARTVGWVARLDALQPAKIRQHAKWATAMPGHAMLLVVPLTPWVQGPWGGVACPPQFSTQCRNEHGRDGVASCRELCLPLE
jgi:hypothetical protein